MIKKNKTLFSTGQFAKFCNVSKQTLIYYDNINLFSPELIDASGYRYYTLAQYDKFFVLQVLKELKTPLCEIKNYLRSRNIDSFMDLLAEKKQDINKEIKRLKNLSAMINNRQKAAAEVVSCSGDDNVLIEHEKEQYLTLSNYCDSDVESDHMMIISKFDNYVRSTMNVGYPVGVIIAKKNLLEKKYKKISYFYVRSHSKRKNSKTLIRPTGLYAKIIHRGSYSSSYKAYGKLSSYLSEHGYVPVGDAYEEDLLDCCSEHKEDNYVIKISIQVNKVG